MFLGDFPPVMNRFVDMLGGFSVIEVGFEHILAMPAMMWLCKAMFNYVAGTFNKQIAASLAKEMWLPAKKSGPTSWMICWML